MKRAQSIDWLLRRTADELAHIALSYEASRGLPDVPEPLKIDIHDFLTHHRAILDYLSHEIAEICSPIAKRPQFPIAPYGTTLAKFRSNLNEKFPRLRNCAPKLFQYLISIQYFEDSPWLAEFTAIVNANKHDNLSVQESGEFVSVIIRFKDRSLRVGELGLKSLNIQPPGALVLKAYDGDTRSIRGPQIIDVNTTRLENADPDIIVERIKWTDFKFDKSNYSGYGLLSLIDQKIRTQVYPTITRLLAEI